jgi:hypothetical protein
MSDWGQCLAGELESSWASFVQSQLMLLIIATAVELRSLMMLGWQQSHKRPPHLFPETVNPNPSPAEHSRNNIDEIKEIDVTPPAVSRAQLEEKQAECALRGEPLPSCRICEILLSWFLDPPRERIRGRLDDPVQASNLQRGDSDSNRTALIDVVAISRSSFSGRAYGVGRHVPVDDEEPNAINILWVKWEQGIAYRVASGFVYEEDWKRLDLEEIDLVLG